MADVSVKLFGVLRLGSGIAQENIDVEKVSDIFDVLNRQIDKQYAEKCRTASENSEKAPPAPDKLSFKDAIIYVNGDRTPKKSKKLTDGDEVWLMSPASGG